MKQFLFSIIFMATTTFASTSWSPLTAHDLAQNVRSTAEVGKLVLTIENARDYTSGYQYKYKVAVEDKLNQIIRSTDRVLQDIHLRQVNDARLCRFVQKLSNGVENAHSYCYNYDSSKFCEDSAKLDSLVVRLDTFISYLLASNPNCQIE